MIKDYYNIKFLNIDLTYLIEELPYSTLVGSSQLILFLDMLKISNFTFHERFFFFMKQIEDFFGNILFSKLKIKNQNNYSAQCAEVALE
jgi:hypothetical protein